MPRIRKAVIPAAGYGTRLFPATKAVKKELFPIVDRQGRAIPVILAIVEEALSAGIESVGIVVQPADRDRFAEFFSAPQGEYLHKLLPKQESAIAWLRNVSDRVTLLTQDTQDGFGHAVFCAKEWVGGEPFLLLLGDHVYRSDTDISCAQQLLAVYARSGQSAIAVETTTAADIQNRGCIMGTWQDQPPTRSTLLTVTQIYEKPDPAYALQHLHVEGLPADQLLSVFGMYALSADIFDYLGDNIQQNFRERGEFQLTSCLDQLQRDRGMVATWVNGRSFDIGLPDHYRQALIHFADA